VTAGERRPVPPAGLRERVLAASLRARTAGRPEPSAPEISPVEAFSRAADAFSGMLRGLREEDWKRPALRGLDVQGLDVTGDSDRAAAVLAVASTLALD
jgi:hypothetical protein